MENSATNVRRIKIIVGYVVIFCIIGFMIYIVKSPAATCSDKIKNQGEKGVDCGGPCSPCKEAAATKEMIVMETNFAPGGNDTYDVIAKISNPNDSIGAGAFNYIFTLKDAEGVEIATAEGTSFILPADTRYVAKLGLKVSGGAIPTGASLSIGDVKWEKLSGIGKPQIGIYNKNFGPDVSSKGIEADGVVRNESIYDLKKIEIIVLLRDKKGEIIGINTTQRDSVRAKEQQNFQVTWPYALKADVNKVEIEAQANVYEEQNFSVSAY